MHNNHKIILKKVRVHNLKDVSLSLDPFTLIVFTGVSGSGKSSLAFDTIFAEGQRRYIDSLSHHSRRYFNELPKPDAEAIDNLSPTIAIEQKTVIKTPRSTVGTITNIYDYLRVIFARIATPHCPISGDIVQTQSREKIIKTLHTLPSNKKILVIAPFVKNKKGAFKEDFLDLQQKGFIRIRLDGEIYSLEDIPPLDAKKNHDIDIVIDRITTSNDAKSRLAEAATTALEIGNGFFSIYDIDEKEEKVFSQYAYCPTSKISYGPLEISDFSFNHPQGMCDNCLGLGETFTYDLNKIIDKDKSISEDCCSIASSYSTVLYGNIYKNLSKLYKFKVTTPWKKLSPSAKNIFLYGTGDKWLKMTFTHPRKQIKWKEYVKWPGVINEAIKRLNNAKSDVYKKKMHRLMNNMPCSSCNGSRIKPYASKATIDNKTISQITGMTIQEALYFFTNLKLSCEDKLIAEEIVKEIIDRLTFLVNVGLHYLSLDRTSPTLSGGESQRVRLASQIGCGLVGTTYILDEPSIGLHPHDHKHLITTLKHLKDQGNTVIIVEHDRDTIESADTIVDIGPKAGKLGGKILAHGDINTIINTPTSITGEFLSYKKVIPLPKTRRKGNGNSIKLYKASHNNLQSVDVTFPLGVMIGITGVSGSGKSSLISDTLYPILSNHLLKTSLSCGNHKKHDGIDNIDKVIFVDQSPIGRTPRSNPGTYIKLLDDIREVFASLPASKIKGYLPGHFSFNVKEGSCRYCKGIGKIRIDMDFMEDVWTICSQCNGKRFDRDILSVEFKGKNIYDVLEMEVKEALDHFSSFPLITKKLTTLKQVGLDYIHIGQPATTLSGGEAQRIKLSKELCRPNTGHTFYILDEPTTGLHFYDVKKLIEILQQLVSLGNTVLIIEHNMEIIKTVDHIIDIGPKAGKDGGKIIATGTPEAIVKLKTPTSMCLKKEMKQKKYHAPSYSPPPSLPFPNITIEGAEQNNLKNIDIIIPHNKMTVMTGPSGSGKTTLAFETIYAEGQRRYVEALPLYVRQFLKSMNKPKVKSINGLTPSIALEQKRGGLNPRSTVGTLTESYDLLRILYSHIGIAYCPETKEKIETISKEFVASQLLKTLSTGTKTYILSPLSLHNEDFSSLVDKLSRNGFLRLRLNNVYYELDETIPFNPAIKNEILLVVDRMIINKDIKDRLLEAIATAAKISDNTLLIDADGKDIFYNLSFAVVKTGKSYPPITPQSFSFNSEQGMCLECSGLGTVYGGSIADNEEILSYTIYDILEVLFIDKNSKTLKLFHNYFKKHHIDINIQLKKLSKPSFDLFLNGDDTNIDIKDKKLTLAFRWKGINNVLGYLAKHARYNIRYPLIPLMEEKQCPTCLGKRLNSLASHVEINNKTLPSLCNMSIDDIYSFCEEIKLTKDKQKLLKETLSQLLQKLLFLKEIGIDYLSLDRAAPTLSGGEMQRIRLARQLGIGLTNCTYILDEPTIGLHPFNSSLLNKALKKLQKLGNTLILVEHDPLCINHADNIIDIGPGAGKNGGTITASGTVAQIKKNKKSLTGQYLSGKKRIAIPKATRKPKTWVELTKLNLHNINNIDLKIPTGVITTVTGLSGSGKSTIIYDILKVLIEKAIKTRKDTIELDIGTVTNALVFDKIIALTQHPIGVSIRSDVSTYSEIMPVIRSFFASLKSAKTQGLQPKNFSYNHKKGMCKSCRGLGYKIVELQFLPPVHVTCDACCGFRLNQLSLQIHYKGKNIGHILQMTVDEAKSFFSFHPTIKKKLEVIASVGLGYLQLGQTITSLSGGEAQRIRLSKELSKRSYGSTLYLFDEPTIGLHSDDINKLIPIFHKLSDKNNTIIIIEHNLDIMTNSDYIIDMGPLAGKNGGKIIATGTPKEVSLSKTSLTSKFLLPLLP
jgi:excinuclease ABC subunit A